VGCRKYRPAGVRLLTAAGLLGLFALSGCSVETVAQFRRLGLPPPASDRAPYVHDLWIGFWIVAAIVGVLMWTLILFAALRYRRGNNEMPKQNRYNLPMEIMYTVAPFIIIAVLFYYTIVAQGKVLNTTSNPPEVTIDVVGQKWAWTFNYQSANNPAVGVDVWEAGTITNTPDLYLPVNKTVRFNLSSPDVIHSFWIPSFYQKLDVVPGRHNSFDAMPNKLGVFPGKCAELCGTYHSAMLFDVHIVSEAEYNAYLKSLADRGQTGAARGPAAANPQAGGGR
jgi:cytochrome c oxidase subunit II